MHTIAAEYPFVYYQGNAIDIEDYVPMIDKIGEYGGELECQISTKIFNTNILIVKSNILNENKDNEDLDESGSIRNSYYYTYYEYFGEFNKDIYVPLCILEYLESCKHYEILYYNENFKGDILINNTQPEYKTMEINNNNLKKGDNHKTKNLLIENRNKNNIIKSKEKNINLDIERTNNIAIEDDKNKYNQASEIDNSDNKNKNSMKMII